MINSELSALPRARTAGSTPLINGSCSLRRGSATPRLINGNLSAVWAGGSADNFPLITRITA